MTMAVTSNIVEMVFGSRYHLGRICLAGEDESISKLGLDLGLHSRVGQYRPGLQ